MPLEGTAFAEYATTFYCKRDVKSIYLYNVSTEGKGTILRKFYADTFPV